MAETAAMNGAEWLARALAQTGMSHVFFVESVMRRTLLQLSDLGVSRCSPIPRRRRPTWPTGTPG